MRSVKLLASFASVGPQKHFDESQWMADLYTLEGYCREIDQATDRWTASKRGLAGPSVNAGSQAVFTTKPSSATPIVARQPD